MSWFARRKPVGEALGPIALESGLYRSPGITRLGQELAGRRPEAILDLGASSTENLSFLSRFTSNLCILDLFHGCDVPGRRAAAFRFESVESLGLPAEDELFDVVLIWDLIHYFEPADRQRFVERLAVNCQGDALIFLIGSSTTSIPLVPIHFKIASADSLYYTLPAGDRMEPGGLTTRQVESLMAGFEPVRCFQLRNGLQEFLFRFRGHAVVSQSEAADPVAV